MNPALTAFTVPSDATLLEAVAGIQRSSARCVAVINERKMVIGVFSEGDVMRALLRGADLHAPIHRLIAGAFVFLPRRDIARAFELMRDRGITFIPVVDEAFELTGVITMRDVLTSSTPAAS